MQEGAGRPAPTSPTPPTGQGRHPAAPAPARPWRAPSSWPRSRPRRHKRWSCWRRRITVVSFFQPGRAARHGPGARAAQGDGLQPRSRAPHQPGPVDGRAVVAGDGVGIPLHAGRRGAAAQVLPHVHDRGGHHPPRQGARARGGRGRPAGHRHGPSARCPGARLRRPRCGQGRGAVPRRQLRRARARVPGRGGGLRPRPVRGVPGPPTRADQQRGGRRRRRDHHRRRPGPPGPGPRDHGHGRAHGRGVGHRRHGGRRRRELRAVGAGPGPRAPRRGGVRALQPAVGHAHPRQLPVLAQRGQLPGPDRRRR